MRIGSARLRVDWGHLILVAVTAGFCLWYWQDARKASADIENLLLIQPAVILALMLCLVIACGAMKLERDEAPAGERAADERPRPAREWRGIAVASLLLLYVVALIPVGFDVATFVFLVAGMYALGERRPVFLLCYSGALAAFLSYSFKVMLSVPVPTLLF